MCVYWMTVPLFCKFYPKNSQNTQILPKNRVCFRRKTAIFAQSVVDLENIGIKPHFVGFIGAGGM